MAETVGGLMSLQGELEESMQAIHRGEKLCCFHKLTNGKQCRNTLSKATLTKLRLTFKEIVELLENGGKGVESLLKEASPLVMCARRHQEEAAAQFKEWSVKIPTGTYKPANSGEKVESLSPSSITELLNDDTPTVSSSGVQISALQDVVDTQRIDRYSSSEPAELSFNPDFDDSGYQSGNEEDFFHGQAIASKITGTAAPSSLAEYTTPQTPKKATKPAPTDSGISLSFDGSDEPQKKQSTRYRDGSESPLAGKSSHTEPVKAESPFSRPAPTPIQPVSLSIQTKRNFVPFKDPFEKMRKYIERPVVGAYDMKEGYIYGFQIEGYAYTKVGSAARGSESSLEASLDARMREHKKAGYSNLKVVLKIPVPHVRRVEKIIHYHLGAGRIKEKCSCLDKPKCGHGRYTEWFNNSLDEIYVVAMAWSHWILSTPYSEIDDFKHQLSSQWLSRLADIQIQSGRDNWLEWLYEHLPKQSRLINKNILGTGEFIEHEPTDEGRVYFLRDNANGIKVEIKRVNTCP